MFEDRVEAGRKLAKELLKYRGQKIVVLAIPRGGVVVGYEVAKELNAPLDIIVPRKIGAPDNPELAIGAVTQDGTVILNPQLMQYLGVSEIYVQEEVRNQVNEIERRIKKYRGEKAYPSLKDKIVILVDDGIATGYTMRAAIASIKKQKPSILIVAVPVGPPDTIQTLKSEADKVVCLSTPEMFQAIGQFYRNFSQTSDEEVIHLLQLSKKTD
ncbi:MAG TPA: phosphoribosyltransferase [archaeon]|nr:phosphoribosyltransferase [archaeon]